MPFLKGETVFFKDGAGLWRKGRVANQKKGKDQVEVYDDSIRGLREKYRVKWQLNEAELIPVRPFPRLRDGEQTLSFAEVERRLQLLRKVGLDLVRRHSSKLLSALVAERVTPEDNLQWVETLRRRAADWMRLAFLQSLVQREWGEDRISSAPVTPTEKELVAFVLREWEQGVRLKRYLREVAALSQGERGRLNLAEDARIQLLQRRGTAPIRQIAQGMAASCQEEEQKRDVLALAEWIEDLMKRTRRRLWERQVQSSRGAEKKNAQSEKDSGSGLFTFSLEALSEGSGMEADRIRRWLDRGSLPLEVLSSSLDEGWNWNPVERRPLIRISEGLYYWPLLHAAPLFGAGWLDEMAGFESEGTAARAAVGVKRRSESLFRRELPGCQLAQNTRWKKRDGTTQKGPDLVVQVDSTLLAAQVSAAGTPSWTEGGTRRFIRRVEAWYRNSRQILTDFRRALMDGKTTEVIGSDGKRINPKDIHRVFLFQLTAEPMAALLERRPDWVGRVASDQDSPLPCFSVGDLENLFALLPGPARKIDYLLKRAARTSGEEGELALLSTYLATGSVEESFHTRREKKRGPGALWPYLEKYWEGKKVPKVQERYTHWWSAILKKLEREQSPGWLEATLLMLQVAQTDQDRFEQSVRALRRTLRREGESMTGRWTVDHANRLAAWVDREMRKEGSDTEPALPRPLRKLSLSGKEYVLITLSPKADVYPCSSIRLL